MRGRDPLAPDPAFEHRTVQETVKQVAVEAQREENPTYPRFLRSRPKQRGMHAASPSSQESEEGALRASCARSVPCAICDDGGQQPVVGGRGTRPGRSGRWTSSPRVGQGMSSLGMICSYDPGGTLLPYKGRLWIISM